MCVIQRGLVSETESDKMTSEAGHHGGGSQLYPNQDQCSVKIKAAGENILTRLRVLILSSICFCKKLLVFLCLMALMLIHAHGKEQTGVCKLSLVDPAIIWDRSSVANPETIGLCPCSSTEQLLIKWVNSGIPQGHRNMENHCSPDPLRPPIPSRANVKVVAMTVLASFGGVGLVGLAGWMLCKRRRAFTEDDINQGLMRGPAAARQSDSKFKIPPGID